MADDLTKGFLRGVQGRESAAPRAEFADGNQLKETVSLQFRVPNTEGKIFLGVIDGTIHEFRDEHNTLRRHITGGTPIGIRDDRHIVTIAGTRAGKGRAALVPNLLTYPGSVLVIDPKGELALLTATRRLKMGQKVVVLDPFGTTASEPVFKPTDSVAEMGLKSAKNLMMGKLRGSFNPLRILTAESKTLVEDAGRIADALIVTSPDAKDPHWDETARMCVETLILHVATSPRFEGRRDLLAVNELLTAVDLPSTKKELLDSKAVGGALAAGAVAIYGRAEDEFSSVLSTARRHLHFLAYQQMQSVLKDEGSIDLVDLKKKEMTVYLCLPSNMMGLCSAWLRLFVNLTLSQMERVQHIPARHAVLMCLDEFAVLGTMKAIEDAAGQIAGLGVKLWPIIQDLGQLKALYKNRWETFLGNAGVVQFFGNSDLTTLEWIEKRLGKTTIISESNNQPGVRARRDDGSVGQSFSETVCPLMTGEEASRFFGRDDELLRQLIIRASYPPMILQRAFYDKHELFSENPQPAKAAPTKPKAPDIYLPGPTIRGELKGMLHHMLRGFKHEE